MSHIDGIYRAVLTGASVAATLTLMAAAPARADFVINDDLIVDGSACIGFDCVNGEAFGFDTIRLKENNLRIKFDDTSVAAAFPRTDWQLRANDSANGGTSGFMIDDISGNRTPFTIEANARSHSLYIDDGGRLGLRTSTPAVEIHTVDGDTPTLRLQQDGSSGFSPQTWDVAGNETNFFIRDVTNGSRLPLRIRPEAPSNSIFIDTDGDVGMGTSSPDGPLHIVGDVANNLPHLTVEATRTDGRAEIWFEDGNTSADNDALRMQLNGDDFNISFNGTGGSELNIEKSGDVSVPNGDFLVTGGDVIVGGTTLNVPDYVFADDYELMPLYEVEKFIRAKGHLPQVPSAAEIGAGKLNMTEMQMTLLGKVEELTLYTLEQHRTITAMNAELQRQNAEIADLRQRLSR